MNTEWSEKTAIVTGAASGIGLAAATELIGRGAKVVVADIDEAGARAAAARLGERAKPAVIDISGRRDCERLVETALDHGGSLDIAVNNAGVNLARGKRLAEIDDDSYRRTMTVNLDGTFNCMREEIRAMVEGGGGSIVNTGSVLSVVGRVGNGAYAATKHAILALTKTAALEYGADGVRVNCVGPGFVPTGLSGGADPSAAAEMVERHHAIPRPGAPEDVAALIVFLASDEAGLCTGGWYPVEAGWTAA